MLSKLYNSVFSEEKKAFYAENHYYTVLLNLLAEEPYSIRLLSDIDRHMVSGQYSAYALDTDLVNDPNIVPSLQGLLMSRLGKNLNNCFCILTDLSSGSGEAVQKVTEALYAGELVASGDKIVVISVLPADLQQAKAAAMEVEHWELPEGVLYYFASQNRYNREQVVNDICAIVLLHSSKAASEEIARDLNRTKNDIRTEIQGFSPEGQQQIGLRRNIPWSTVVTAYKDNRMVFLKKYLLELLNRVEGIESFDASGFCHTFFNQHSSLDPGALLDMLKCAVNRIPLTSPPAGPGDMTLQTYLNMCYSTGGYGGEKVLELTLKVNLARNRRSSPAMVKKAAEEIMENMGIYDSDDLVRDVTRALAGYAGQQKKTCDDKKRMLPQFLETASAGENELEEFIKRYISYDFELRKWEFWLEVSQYIQHNREEFAALCAEAAGRTAEMERLKSELYTGDAGDAGIEIGMTYPARVLLAPQESEDFCKRCRGAYARYERTAREYEEEMTANIRRQFDRIYDVHSSFRRDYGYCFDASGAFSINVKHRNGNYLVFDM